MTDAIDLAAVEAAATRIAPHVHRTPVVTSRLLDQLSGSRLFLKCENLQRGGAFKIRGATNAVLQLTDDEAARGVVGTSSGNHAQALALAAAARGIPATVVMHDDAPAVKADAVRDYGATIVPVPPTLEAREAAQRAAVEDTGASVIPPFDDDRIIAGQGTAALELLAEVPDLDVVIAPIGGGGLMSGTAVAVHGTAPDVQCIGAEPRLADDAHRSLEAGSRQPAVSPPQTIADGLLTALGERTFPILARHLEEIVLVEEHEIVEAMRLLFTRTKLVVEPSGAVPLAAALVLARRDPSPLRDRRVGIILSGGNRAWEQVFSPT